MYMYVSDAGFHLETLEVTIVEMELTRLTKISS
jgi:hypothetical protein